MKRSEMVSLIFKRFEKERPLTASKYMAHAALEIAEESGMLSPKIMLPLKYDSKGKQLQAEYAHKWEDE